VALTDSAAAAMRSSEQRAKAMSVAGRVCGSLGLPLDALQYCAALRARAPDHTPVIPRVSFVVKSLRDPLPIPSGRLSLKSLQARGTPAYTSSFSTGRPASCQSR
jgi:hypothetical protein